jgi:hypothetical protein
LECANLLALWYFYQSVNKLAHSKETPDSSYLRFETSNHSLVVMQFELGVSLECGDLSPLGKKYQSANKLAHSKETPDSSYLRFETSNPNW